ncbi:hypothetical protein PAAG_05523 [Paracoccidioides lutzii Pb01]|uniref:Uncharacterized protein n=1 Tax=Paracoccidioides lutzii (strain ATCC MYA-826 / Pb01) TaxID=502779 RepID=C1H430_PARBA|nr:hypothetical protein PAAG_05523 [Paracoccidioides lutzii Pb01]EEH34474.2 hypothetical protein PAAG_05523 [Paracoccidioides lutzii Pb01]
MGIMKKKTRTREKHQGRPLMSIKILKCIKLLSSRRGANNRFFRHIVLSTGKENSFQPNIIARFYFSSRVQGTSDYPEGYLFLFLISVHQQGQRNSPCKRSGIAKQHHNLKKSGHEATILGSRKSAVTASKRNTLEIQTLFQRDEPKGFDPEKEFILRIASQHFRGTASIKPLDERRISDHRCSVSRFTNHQRHEKQTKSQSRNTKWQWQSRPPRRIHGRQLKERRAESRGDWDLILYPVTGRPFWKEVGYVLSDGELCQKQKKKKKKKKKDDD